MFAAAIRCSVRQFSSLNPTTSSSTSKLLSPQRVPDFYRWTFRRNIRQRSEKNGKGTKETGGEHAPEHIAKQFQVAPDKKYALRKPLLFAFGVTGVSFVGCSIWHYERYRKRIDQVLNPGNWRFIERNPEKFSEIRNKINNYWNRLTIGQKTVFAIAGLNTLVFLAWRLPSAQRIMMKYFTGNPFGSASSISMLGSAFSHYSLIHLGVNMYVLSSFSTVVVDHLMGLEQFTAFYLSAAVVSSYVSYTHKMIAKNPAFSLGASGAILAVLAYTCCKIPDSRLSIVFVPWFDFSAATGLKAIIALDAIGILLKWKLFDHAAHLGGTMFGIAYAMYLEQWLWKGHGGLRDMVINNWRQIRGDPPGFGPGPGFGP